MQALTTASTEPPNQNTPLTHSASDDSSEAEDGGCSHWGLSHWFAAIGEYFSKITCNNMCICSEPDDRMYVHRFYNRNNKVYKVIKSDCLGAPVDESCCECWDYIKLTPCLLFFQVCTLPCVCLKCSKKPEFREHFYQAPPIHQASSIHQTQSTKSNSPLDNYNQILAQGLEQGRRQREVSAQTQQEERERINRRAEEQRFTNPEQYRLNKAGRF